MALLAARHFPDGCGSGNAELEDKNTQCLPKRFLTQRKASAVRDFLPLFEGFTNGKDHGVCQEGFSSSNNKKLDLQNLTVDDNPLKKVAAAVYHVKDVKSNIQDNTQDKYVCKRKLLNIYEADCERNAFGPSSRMENTRPKLQVSADTKVVRGLISKSACPWSDAKDEGERKKVSFVLLPYRSKRAIKSKCHFGQKPLKKKETATASEESEIWPNENSEDLQVFMKPHELDVNATPSSHSNFTGDENDSDVIRKRVKETLRLFRDVCRKLLQEGESNSTELGNRKRVDLIAARILRDKGNYVNSGKQILGNVPGVEVGDEFQYRVELNIIGLHRQIQGGIDYVKNNGKILATSVVASGGYADYLVNSDVLIYTGQGGNVMNTDKKPKDQKLERGNLALKNSSEVKNPVRVISGSESVDDRYKTYVYDGLYVVVSYWLHRAPHGKLVYKFCLQRVPGQKLALKGVKKSK